MWGKFWELIIELWCILMYTMGIVIVTTLCFTVVCIALFGLVGFLYLLGGMLL